MMKGMRQVVKGLSIRWDSGGYLPLGTVATDEKKVRRCGCLRMLSIKRLIFLVGLLLAIPVFLELSSVVVWVDFSLSSSF